MTISNVNFTATHHLDTQGLICPEPVMMLHKTIRRADSGDIIEVLCRHLGHELLGQETLAKNISLSVDPDEITIDSDNKDPVSATLYRYLVKKKSA